MVSCSAIRLSRSSRALLSSATLASVERFPSAAPMMDMPKLWNVRAVIPKLGRVDTGKTLPHFATGGDAWHTEFEIFSLEDLPVPFRMEVFDSHPDSSRAATHMAVAAFFC